MENHKADPNRKHYHIIASYKSIAHINLPFHEKTKIKYKKQQWTAIPEPQKEIKLSRALYNTLNQEYGRSTVYWNSETVTDANTFTSYLEYIQKDFNPIYLYTNQKYDRNLRKLRQNLKLDN